jgi:predicted transcriptional regulator of viral defense system
VAHLPDTYKKVIELARRPGGVRARELEAAGLYATYAGRLVAMGYLVKLGRGTYGARAVRSASVKSAQLAKLAAAAPKGVICLTSALHFHGLIKREPDDFWIAIGTNSRRPAQLKGKARFIQVAQPCLEEGVEIRRLDGVEVGIFSAPKSVADAFKFRRRVGIDVAIEAFKAFRRQYPKRSNELRRAAVVCRVERVMHTYAEAIEAVGEAT